MKKFLLICLAILLSIQGAAAAKENSDTSQNKRVNIAIEVTDTSRHSDLDTAKNLENFFRAEKSARLRKSFHK